MVRLDVGATLLLLLLLLLLLEVLLPPSPLWVVPSSM
jgi:hypothetical protein